MVLHPLVQQPCLLPLHPPAHSLLHAWDRSTGPREAGQLLWISAQAQSGFYHEVSKARYVILNIIIYLKMYIHIFMWLSCLASCAQICNFDAYIFCHSNSLVLFYFSLSIFLLKRADECIYLSVHSSLSDIIYSAKSLVRKTSRSWSDKVQMQK